MSGASPDPSAVMAHARALLTLAESLPPAAPGNAGLAYQAADLAIKVLLIERDGADIWTHVVRRERVQELIGIPALDQALLHHVRQLDFYADAAAGAPLELPSVDDRALAVKIARRIFDAVAQLRSAAGARLPSG